MAWIGCNDKVCIIIVPFETLCETICYLTIMRITAFLLLTADNIKQSNSCDVTGTQDQLSNP